MWPATAVGCVSRPVGLSDVREGDSAEVADREEVGMLAEAEDGRRSEDEPVVTDALIKLIEAGARPVYLAMPEYLRKRMVRALELWGHPERNVP